MGAWCRSWVCWARAMTLAWRFRYLWGPRLVREICPGLVDERAVCRVFCLLASRTSADLPFAISVKGVLSFSKVILEETVHFLEKNDIHPAIADVYDFEDMPKALQALMSQSKVGKIVVRV